MSSRITSLSPLSDFSIFEGKLPGNKTLHYLDSAATSQKPQIVLDAIAEYYKTSNANVHRGIHALGDKSTQALHEARKTIASFFGAEEDEFIFTRNTTESLNGLAYGLEHLLKPEDEIVLSIMEHHSNIVPWQELAKRTGAVVRYIGITEDGQLDLKKAEELFTNKTRIVSIVHISNALGTHNDLEKIAKMARSASPDCWVVADGAQSAPHIPISFQSNFCDAYAFSGHKMLGPMGAGGLLVRKERISQLQPWFLGGGMIDEVNLINTTFADLPDRFMPGTPDVASVVGLAAACKYLSNFGMEAIQHHDHLLVQETLERLKEFPLIQIVGPTNADLRIGSVAFLYKGVHAHDVAQILDSEGVAVRSGHHCTMPLHNANIWVATTRASFGMYNSSEDIDKLVEGLKKVEKVFRQ